MLRDIRRRIYYILVGWTDRYPRLALLVFALMTPLVMAFRHPLDAVMGILLGGALAELLQELRKHRNEQVAESWHPNP